MGIEGCSRGEQIAGPRAGDRQCRPIGGNGRALRPATLAIPSAASARKASRPGQHGRSSGWPGSESARDRRLPIIEDHAVFAQHAGCSGCLACVCSVQQVGDIEPIQKYRSVQARRSSILPSGEASNRPTPCAHCGRFHRDRPFADLARSSRSGPGVAKGRNRPSRRRGPDVHRAGASGASAHEAARG